MASFGIDKNGQLLYTTFYDLSNNIGKLKDYIKGLDKDLLYFKGILNFYAWNSCEIHKFCPQKCEKFRIWVKI